jgi:pimeloyl-ACP methyl ester carboxylesterase
MLSSVRGPMVAAHSFGGLVATQMAAAHGDLLSGLVVIDTPIHPRSRTGTERRPRGTAIYSSLAAALARFQLMPPQPVENIFLLDWVARHSLKQVGGGAWRWKFDPEIWRHFLISDTAALIGAATCPTAIFHGQHSTLMNEAAVALVWEKLGGKSDIIRIPGAHHHVMLDQPLALVGALQRQFAAWGGAS